MDDRLMLLAAEGRWSEFSTAVVLPENRADSEVLMARLEELGDTSVASGLLGAALLQFSAAAQCGMMRTFTGINMREAEEFGAPIVRLYAKLAEAKRRLEEEIAKDSKGLVDWSTTPARVIELALEARYVEAHNLLGRLGDTRTAEKCVACGELLESAADRLPETARAMRLWLYENALEQYGWAAEAMGKKRVNERLGSFRPASAKPVVRGPAPVDRGQLIAQLEKLARARKFNDCDELLKKPRHRALAREISTHFEMLGDAAGRVSNWSAARDFYCVARLAGDPKGTIEAKLDAAEEARIAYGIANPTKEAAIPENLDWDAGLDVVESLVLARRFPEANALYRKLHRTSWDSPARFEKLGDRLATTCPEIARWCYEKMYAFLRTLPEDNASQAHMNGMLESEMLTKLDAVKKRIRGIR